MTFPMDLITVIDQVMGQIENAASLPEEDRLLGIPSSLTGIDLNAVRGRIEEHREHLHGKLGREIHPVVALLDLVSADTDGEFASSLDAFCLLKKSALRDLIQAALYDNLTGLYSRNILESRLLEEFQRAKRYSLPLSVLFIETDAFKNINDTYGHLEGDRVLSFIGRFIRDHIREVDFPARYGGDEFVVILPHTQGETALFMARRIHREIGEAQETSDLCTTVTISIGVGTLTPDMESVGQFVEAADRAMYKAKTNRDMVWPIVNADPQQESE